MIDEKKNPEIPSKKAETQNLDIRQKIVDMEVYGLNIIGGWSIKHQKLLGDYMAGLMHNMVGYANRLQYSWNKKQPLADLDMANHTLKDLVLVAYRGQYLKGNKTFAEWSRQIEEIGAMIGGYYKYVYPDKK